MTCSAHLTSIGAWRRPGLLQSRAERRFRTGRVRVLAAGRPRVWSQLFSSRGLVVVEPQVVRAAVPSFSRLRSNGRHRSGSALEDVTERLIAAGYKAAITSEDAGFLYTFDADGQRVRVRTHRHIFKMRPRTRSVIRQMLRCGHSWPMRVCLWSPACWGRARRPIRACSSRCTSCMVCRSRCSILGTAIRWCLGTSVERIEAYQTSVTEVLAEQVDSTEALAHLLPAEERELFLSAQSGVEAALSPLRDYVEGVDPSLTRTWSQTVRRSVDSLAKLEQRATKARMGQLGFSKLELRRIQNALLAQIRLQERVLPFAHFYSRHGPSLIDLLYSAGELGILAITC